MSDSTQPEIPIFRKRGQNSRRKPSLPTANTPTAPQSSGETPSAISALPQDEKQNPSSLDSLLATGEAAARAAAAARTTSQPPKVPTEAATVPLQQFSNDDDTEEPIPTLKLVRKFAKSRKGGVEFLPTTSRTELPEIEQDKEDKPEEMSALDAWNQRFSIQGARMKEDMNRHIEDVDDVREAFIDRKLGLSVPEDSISGLDDEDPSSEKNSKNGPKYSSLGSGTINQIGFAQAVARVEEIDLGDETRERNIQRTRDALRRRHEREQAEAQNEEYDEDARKAGRQSQKRSREDILRDKIVEQVLADAKIMRYDYSAPQLQAESSHNDGRFQTADDRMAEQFRREFFDNQAERSSRRSRHPPRPSGGVNKSHQARGPRGPRLGGSRTARAAAKRAMESEKAKK